MRNQIAAFLQKTLARTGASLSAFKSCKSPFDRSDALYIAGSLFIIKGVNFISVPSAHIVAGILLMFPAVLALVRNQDSD